MDEYIELNGITFVWNQAKASRNRVRHGVSFEEAAEVFFDPFLRVVDASPDEEVRDAIIGMSERWNLLFVVHILFADEQVRIIFARRATRKERSFMKIEKLTRRLDKNRPMTAVTLRMPEDVVDDLKRIAPLLGFSGYQPLIRAYVGHCLRRDLERLDTDAVSELVAGLKRRGVDQDVIEEALAEAMHR